MLILLWLQVTFTRKQDGFILYPSRIFVVPPAIPSTVSRTSFVTVVTLNDWYERVMERSNLIILKYSILLLKYLLLSPSCMIFFQAHEIEAVYRIYSPPILQAHPL